MKKFIFLALMIAATVLTNSAANLLSFGQDSIRINPSKLDGYTQHVVTLQTDAYADSWIVAVSYPQGLFPKLVAGVSALDGMSIPYLDRYGVEQICQCPLNVSAQYATISSSITTLGYYDYNYDNEYESYGTVKWSAGSHAMWEYNLYVDPEFREGYITFDGTISSGSDMRGAILQGVRVFSRTWFWVGYEVGDCTGNGKITIDDVTTLIHYLLTGEGLDEFEEKAADVNGDGRVTINDVTDLIHNLITA